MPQATRHTKQLFVYYFLGIIIIVNLVPFFNYLKRFGVVYPIYFFTLVNLWLRLLEFTLVAYWGYQLYRRIVSKQLRRIFISIAFLLGTWIFATCVRNDFTGELTIPSMLAFQRWCWYYYYVPWTACPFLFFQGALHIGLEEGNHPSPRWLVLWIPQVLLILGILTNDMHQQAFLFPQGLAASYEIYEHNWLYWVAFTWICAFSLFSLVVLYYRSKVIKVRSYSYLALGAFLLGQAMSWAGYFHIYNFRVTESSVFASVLFGEICLRTGLIPTNSHYRSYVKESLLQAYIVNNKGEIVTRPREEETSPWEWIQQPIVPERELQGHYLLHSAPIIGGHVLWVENQQALHKLRRQLEEVQERLSEEHTLISERNQLKKRRARIDAQRNLYDSLAVVSSPYTAKMLEFLRDQDQEKKEGETQLEPKQWAVLCLHMAYLKRRNNMVLLGHEQKHIHL